MARKTAKKQAEAPKVDIGAEDFRVSAGAGKAQGHPCGLYGGASETGADQRLHAKTGRIAGTFPADNVVVDLSEHGLVHATSSRPPWRRWRIPRWRSRIDAARNV